MRTSGTVVIKQSKPRQTSERKETRKLKQLAEKSESVIYEVSSVFPFQLFPDKIIIDEVKVTLVYKSLFYKHIFPVLYSDLLSVQVTRGLIFASLTFEVRGFEQNPSPITHLWPEDAGKAERRIMGLLSAKREDVKTTKISTKDLSEVAKRVGTSDEEPENLF